MRRGKGSRNVVLAPLVLLLCASSLFAQSGEIRYLYDELDRLAGVVDRNGDLAAYAYDSVGNLLRIDRINVSELPGDVAISLVHPNKGRVGTRVQIFGKGFSATPSQNTITFNGTPAVVLEASPLRLLTTVPIGATTGPLVVTTPLGTASATFTVLAETVTVSPATDTVVVGQGRLFTATVTGLADPRVTWSVNGITGGSVADGTITDAGVYTAPSQVPTPAQVTIRATSVAQPQIFGEARATITATPSHFAPTAALSVRFGAPAPGTTSSSSVSVSFGDQAPAITQTAPLSVQFGPQPSGTMQSHEVSVTTGPVVTLVNPATGAQGTTGLALTVGGANLSGTSALTFLLNGTVDTNLQATNIAVNPEGTQLIATININGTAPLGARVVRVVTPGGGSTAFDIGTNLFTITAP